MSESIAKNLKQKWQKFQAQKKWLKNFPDQNPVLVQSKREENKTGVYFLKPYILDYRQMAENLLKDRNKTIRQSFVWYCCQFLSKLIEQELGEYDILEDDESKQQVYSLNLKKISRNYSLFNELLIAENILEVHSLHDAEKGKCIEYGIYKEIIKKGICCEYLSKDEVKRLKNEAKQSSSPDKTKSPTPSVVKHFVDTLKQTKVKEAELDLLEVEAGRYQRLYPLVMRFIAGKYDASIGENEGRFHANYTYAPSEFRSLMRYGGKHRLVEGDVAACHFHFLLDETDDPKERENMVADLATADPYLSMCGHPAGVSRDDLKQSSHLFKFGSRADVRRFVSDYDAMKIVPYRKGLFYRHLLAKYPKFAEAMARKPIKHKKHKSDFACAVMRQEAAVMVHAVGKRCADAGLVYLPIHDGFLTLPGHYNKVCEIVVEAFRERVGSVPRIRRK